MYLQPVKTTVNGGIPVYQKILEYAQGGFTLDNLLTDTSAGNTIKAGTPVAYNEATRIARIVQTFELQANAADDAVAYRVKKGHLAKVGTIIASVVGGKAYAITAINTSNAAYDEFTVGTTLAVALTAGDVLFESSAAGAAAAVYAQSADGLLFEDTEVVAGQDQATCSIVIRGTVYARRVPQATAAIKLLLPHIIYSQSY